MTGGSTAAARTPSCISDALSALVELGQVALIDSESGGMPRAVLTAAGAGRFERLCQLAVGMSAARFKTIMADDPGPPDGTMAP